MSWKKFCGDGRGFWKIVEHLNEYNEGGEEEGWDALRGYYGISNENSRLMSRRFMVGYNTDWCLWEQENNKIDIYSELLKFAHEHHLEDMVVHCIIRLAKKILTWSENTSVDDVFADLQRKAMDSTIFKDLLKLAKEVMSRRKN